MSGSADFSRDAIAKQIFKNAAFTNATTLWVALFTASPNSAGGGTEVTTVGTGYNRANMTTASWTTNGVGSFLNNAAIVYTTNAPGGWGSVVAVAITDSSQTSASGNYYYWGPLTASVTVNANDIVQFSSGALVVAYSS